MWAAAEVVRTMETILILRLEGYVTTAKESEAGMGEKFASVNL